MTGRDPMDRRMGWHVKLYLNHAYLYFLNLYYVLLGLLPEPFRGLGYALVLKRQGRGVFYDARVYIKFPWLVEVGHKVSFNRGVEIYPSYVTGHGVVIGDNVRIGPNVRLLAAGHDVDSHDLRELGGVIHIGNDCWIGAGAMILRGQAGRCSGCAVAGGARCPRQLKVAGVRRAYPHADDARMPASRLGSGRYDLAITYKKSAGSRSQHLYATLCCADHALRVLRSRRTYRLWSNQHHRAYVRGIAGEVLFAKQITAPRSGNALILAASD